MCTIGFRLMLASGALVLCEQPARAHSQAACKIEALYACQDMQGKHGICVQYAVQLCAGHSHAIGNLPLHSRNPGPVGPRRHGLNAAGSMRHGATLSHRGTMGLRMGSIGRIGR
jgi:hypothetical protein